MSNAATIEIRGEHAQLKQALGEATAMFERFGGVIKKVGQVVITYLGFKKLYQTLRDLVKGAADEERVFTRLETAVKSTGERAGFTAVQLKKMADQLEDVTTFSGEAGQRAMIMMTRFENIRGDVFKDAITGAADLASYMETSLPQAAQQLGRALNDPIHGMGLLRRSGILLSEQQQDLVRKLQISGDVMGAQRVILDKLRETYGGAAAADAKTFAGRWDMIKNKLGAARDAIGAALIPALEALMPAVELAVYWFKRFADFFNDYVGPVITRVWTEVVQTLKPVFDELILLGSVFYDHFRVIGDDFMGVVAKAIIGAFKVIAAIVTPILQTLTVVTIGAFVAMEVAIESWQDVAALMLTQFAKDAVTSFNVVVHFLTSVIPEALRWFGDAWSGVWKTALSYLKSVMNAMWENIKKLWADAKSLLQGKGGQAFKWTALSEGFENTLKELPVFTKRIPTMLEKSLGSEVERLGGKVGQSFTDKFDARMKKAMALRDKVLSGGGTPEAIGEGIEPDPSKFREFSLRDYERKKKRGDGRGQGDKDQGPGFEDLFALQRRIQEAALQSPEQKATEKQTELQTAMHQQDMNMMQQQNAILEEQNELIEEQVESLDELAHRGTTAVYA